MLVICFINGQCVFCPRTNQISRKQKKIFEIGFLI